MTIPRAKRPSTYSLRRTVQQVQVAFPQVYLACHTRHQRKKSTAHHLSARDASILAHLDQEIPVTPATLATHLGVARSTLSEALKRLHALGYVSGPQNGDGRRRTSVLLAPLGASAISDTSVLETPRLLDALAKASERELRAIAQGLTLLARKCRGSSSDAAWRRGVAR